MMGIEQAVCPLEGTRVPCRKINQYTRSVSLTERRAWSPGNLGYITDDLEMCLAS